MGNGKDDTTKKETWMKDSTKLEQVRMKIIMTAADNVNRPCQEKMKTQYMLFS